VSATYLLTALGMGRYEEVTYRQEGRGEFRTAFAPLATAKIYGLEIKEGLALCTPSASTGPLERMTDAFAQAGIALRSILVPEPSEPDHIEAVFNAIVDAIPRGAELWLDVTYGFRSFPFVTFAALAYLRGLLNVPLLGCTYGAFDAKGPDGSVPIVELNSVISLLDWFSALSAVRDTGSLRPLATLTSSRLLETLRRSGEFRNALSVVNRRLPNAAKALAARLPIEFGIEAEGVGRQLRELAQEAWPERVVGEAVKSVFGTFEHLALSERPDLRAPTKGEVELNQGELDRQIAFAEYLLKIGDVGGAGMVLRECVVNLQLYAAGVNTHDWLKLDRRQIGEEALAQREYRVRLASETRSKQWLRPGDCEFAAVWAPLRELRNKYAHVGARPDAVKVDNDARLVIDLLAKVRALLFVPQTASAGSHLTAVISPLGNSAGLLYTVVHALKPDVLICVTSAQARRGGEVAIERACSEGQTLRSPVWIEIADPYTGFKEIDGRVPWAQLAELLAPNDSIDAVLNLTGGTSVLQYCAERVAGQLKHLGIPIRRVAAVDRRGPAEQQAKPFVVGEIVELDDTLAVERHL
jgi:CRISPR-associated DxTHG motif protein